MKSNDMQNRGAVIGTGWGLLLMAVFTCMWAVLAENGIGWKDHYTLIMIFSLAGLVFAVAGFSLIIHAKKVPEPTSAEDRAEGKRIGKWFGITFGAEGLAIFIVVNILVPLDLADYIMPAIALVVGLHFYPMAKIFRRKIDYYIATWSCLVAFAGMVIIKEHLWGQSTLFVFIGVGMAMATTAYGVFMMLKGKCVWFAGSPGRHFL